MAVARTRLRARDSPFTPSFPSFRLTLSAEGELIGDSGSDEPALAVYSWFAQKSSNG